MKEFFDTAWLWLVRWRTWLIGAVGVVAWALPDMLTIASELLRSKELVAVLPDSWKAWAGLVALVCAIWSRPRPAATPNVAKRQHNHDDFKGENV